jgi:hypothetical protein
MLHTVLIVSIIFVLTVVIIMSGRGGGNFNVIALVLAGVQVHTASTTSQFILAARALAGALVFGKAKTMSWPLVLFYGGLNASMAFAGVAMPFPEKQASKTAVSRLGYWNIAEVENRYVINLRLAVPLTLTTRFHSISS